MRLAAHYPHSRFTGYDLSESAIAFARKKAAEKGLQNIRFEVKDLTDWDEPEAFDWVLALDAIHDQARPDKVLAGIRRTLRPDGVFLMQDIDAHSEPAENLTHPLAPMLYAVSCLHCMTVSLAQGGMGLGAMWGEEKARELLAETGFADVQVKRFPHDVQNAYYVIRAA